MDVCGTPKSFDSKSRTQPQPTAVTLRYSLPSLFKPQHCVTIYRLPNGQTGNLILTMWKPFNGDMGHACSFFSIFIKYAYIVVVVVVGGR